MDLSQSKTINTQNTKGEISNNAFSTAFQNKVFFYFLLISATILAVLKMPMAQIYYSIVQAALTFAPIIVIGIMGTIALINFKKYPNYRNIIRKFYLTFTLKFVLAILIFYFLYAPFLFINPILAGIQYLKTIATLEGFFYFLSYFLTAIIVLAVIFVATRAYQKTKGTYTGSIQKLIRKTLYAVFFLFLLVGGASAVAYPEAYKPLTNTLGDTIYTLSAGNIQAFKGDDLANYKKIKSLGEFASNLSTSLSETGKNISESNQEYKANLDLATTELKNSIATSTADLKNKINDDLGGKFSTDNGTVTISSDIAAKGDLDMKGNLILGLKDPINTQDATNKKYVDEQITLQSFWQRSGTTLSSINDNDSLNIGSGIITAGGLTLNGVMNSQSIIPLLNSTYNLGSATNYFSNLYTKNIYMNSGAYFDGTDSGEINTQGDFSISGRLGIGTKNPAAQLTIKGTDETDGPTLGDELLSNSGWTTTGWTGDFTSGFTKSTSSADVLSNSLAAEVGAKYQVTVIVTGGVNILSYVDVQFGGVSLGGGIAAMVLPSPYPMTYGIIATSTSNLTVAPAVSIMPPFVMFDGTVNISIKKVTNKSSPFATFAASNGSTIMEIRAGRTSGDFYIGKNAGQYSFGGYNTVVGNNAFENNVSGTLNVGFGYRALGSNASGRDNVAIGSYALYSNTTAIRNVAIGANALLANTTGSENTAVGWYSLYANTTGINNAAFGKETLSSNTTGNFNAIFGSQAFKYNTTGSNNAALGFGSLLYTTSSNSTAVGAQSGRYLSTGANNIFLGYQAGDNLTTGSNNIIIGYDIDSPTATNSNTLTIGNLIFGTGINGTGTTLSTGNVGIGTISPGTKLSVVGAGGTFGEAISWTGSVDYGGEYRGYAGYDAAGGTTAFIGNEYAGTSSRFQIRIGTSPKLTVQDDGLVGIGTTTPGYKLDIQGGTGEAADFVNSRWGYKTNGSDYAEYFYSKDTNLKAGESVCVDTTIDNAVKRCANDGDNNVMGIVSTNPSVVGNSNGLNRDKNPNYKIIGMIGQVPGYVENIDNETIQIGDALTASNTPGYMRKAKPGESTVGVALQNATQPKQTIQILISRKNKSLTVENVEAETEKRIAEMNIQDQVDSLIAKGQANLDEKINAKLATLDTNITTIQDLNARLEAQIQSLRELTNQNIALTNDMFESITNLTSTDTFTKNGDFEILGTLTSEVLETGQLVIKINEDNKTIGSAFICPAEKILSSDAKTCAEDASGDGKSVKVLTNNVTDRSKIFITFTDDLEGKSYFISSKKKGESFTVKLSEPIEAGEDKLDFDWWIVEAEE